MKNQSQLKSVSWRAVAVAGALLFTAGMVHSAERTVLAEFITADW